MKKRQKPCYLCGIPKKSNKKNSWTFENQEKNLRNSGLREDKRLRYFFFLDETNFSKILCSEENIFLWLNVKDALEIFRFPKKKLSI